MSDSPPNFPMDLAAAARTLAADRVTAEILTSFHKADIEAILLKGPALARWLYPEGGRTYRDSDLLVSTSSLAAAESILTKHGFVHLPLSDIPGDRPWHAHEWIRERDFAGVDLHRVLIGVGAKPDEFWKVMVTHTEPMMVAGVAAQVPTWPALAMHVALHAAQDGTKPTKSIVDLQRALDSVSMDLWQGAAAIAQRCDARHALGAGLRLLPEGRTVAERLGLPSDAPLEVVIRARSSREALAVDWLATIPTVRGKLAFISSKLFPPPEFMRAWTPLAHKGRLGLPLAYSYRLGWLAVRGGPALLEWIRLRVRPPRS